MLDKLCDETQHLTLKPVWSVQGSMFHLKEPAGPPVITSNCDQSTMHAMLRSTTTHLNYLLLTTLKVQKHPNQTLCLILFIY